MGKFGKRNYGTFFISLIFIILNSNSALSQTNKIFDNEVFKVNIKTVLCANSSDEQSFPMINLGSSDRILVSFDDTDGGIKNYYFSIEHCTREWESSDLQVLNYVTSFHQDRINIYNYSQATTQKYTHYSFSFPNDQVQPKISGNYILKVMLDGDEDKIVFTQRFYVLDNKASVAIQMTPSLDVRFRGVKQKINFTVNSNALAVQNPYKDINVLILQNRRPDNAIWNNEPRSIAGNQLVYDGIATNDFWGGNEFRLFDIRSLRRLGVNVSKIEKEGDSLIMVQLAIDQLRAGLPYSQFFDNNGKFFVRINDFSNAVNDIQSDYATVFFTLNAEASSKGGDVYVLGLFNNYRYKPENKMFYDQETKSYYLKARLKQGVYDYIYAYVSPDGKASESETEGSFFATSNEYQALVYFRRPSSRYDELVGYGYLNTDNSTGRNL